MTGSSLEAADDMRAAIVRADNAAILAGLERDFVAASVQNGVTASEALAVWLLLARFAAYSFNKAHAASYAELAWQSAYLKTHYPVELPLPCSTATEVIIRCARWRESSRVAACGCSAHT
jgi:DNA polymerase III alpha subunit